MKSFLTHRKYMGGIFLFIFLLSGNALLYSSHFVVEIGHDEHSVAGHSCDSDPSGSSTTAAANQQQDGGNGEQHEDGTSCCDSHSHVSLPCQPICYSHTPRLIALLAGDPTGFIPEVYLDKFIPPQNLS